MNDVELAKIDWKNASRLCGRQLELHAEGLLGNENLAKLPLRPILCIDQISHIDSETIEASFTFPESAEHWPYDTAESLEMLFQDQLDQLIGFWGSRKADGYGRALSPGASSLNRALKFTAGAMLHYKLERRKWIVNNETGIGTAVFNGHILDSDNNLVLDSKNIIVGILPPANIMELRKQFGGMLGVSHGKYQSGNQLMIPIYDPSSIQQSRGKDKIASVTATQQIDPNLWPLQFHFKDDPVVPGNFGTHGVIALLKTTARNEFGLSDPVFDSFSSKKFSGMIFEDPKQIRFELLDVSRGEQGQVKASKANLYLETATGERLIESPIYTFKNVVVHEDNTL